MAFILATWNILATSYIRREYYPHTPAGLLDPAWRVPALVRHAAALGADILCLQEVERDVFTALRAGLDGYAGSHALKGGKRPDGCATFFRRDRFTPLSDRRVAYSDGSGHIAQVLVLDDAGRRLEVLNTHLKWDPPETARERQWGYRQISQALDSLGPEAAGQILCGDLNVLPDSTVVRTLRSAGFDYAHRRCPGVWTSNANGEAKLIDYLFYGGSLRADPLLPPPLEDETPLPSPEQPSDHLPLCAQFEWLAG